MSEKPVNDQFYGERYYTGKINYKRRILITIISCDYLNLSLADEHVGGVTIPTQVIRL
jgi:hypothetical protein